MTAQATDQILIDGVEHELFTNPLEMFKEMYRRDWVFFEDHPNTACWRGYVAEWEINEGRLFLLKVNGNISYKGHNTGRDRNKSLRWEGIHPELFQNKVPATLSELFGPERDRVPATWYSGELRVPLGSMIKYIHAGYGSEYSKYLLIPVVNGVCGEQKYVTDKEYKKMNFPGGNKDDEETEIDGEIPF